MDIVTEDSREYYAADEWPNKEETYERVNGAIERMRSADKKLDDEIRMAQEGNKTKTRSGKADIVR